ncbi:hypothetical protein ACHQM5_029426 [Ranunculus cassubicifolius]
MAVKMNNKAAMVVLIISLLLIVSIAEARPRAVGAGTPTCTKVVGVQRGQTCFNIIQSNKLSTTQFGAINPNINCSGLFVGQWVCIVGTVN